jgi:hypothetical protein
MTSETPTIVRPEGTAFNAPGQRYWTIPQCESLIGRDVIVRDWYATFPARVEGIAEVGKSGFVTCLLLTYAARDGQVTRAFSLNITREIEVTS